MHIIINKFKLYFIIFLFLLKISSSFAYFLLLDELDYSEIFNSYCLIKSNNFNFDPLGFVHSKIFVQFCFLGKDLFFWTFSIFICLFLLFAFSKLFDYSIKKLNLRLLIYTIFLSPTVLFFSSAPTKDGFLCILICISIIFKNKIGKVLLFISSLIKPYLIIAWIFVNKFSFIFIILFIITLLIFFYSNIFFIINKKLTSIGSVNFEFFLKQNYIWLVEYFAIIFFALRSKEIKITLFLIILIISMIGLFYNFNVGSRIITLSTFFLITLSYVFKKNNRIYRNS
jgi:hypothetical protein